MRTFKHFPENLICKLCGTNKDKECVLAGIDNTEEGKNEEGTPIHVDCINLRYNQEMNFFYQRGLMGF